jgi:hypothetical protein
MTDVDGGDGRTYHVRRQRRSTLTIIVVLLALGGAFYYASSYFRDTTPKPGPCTTEVPTAQIRPRSVSVNVYNATTRRGLALSVSKAVAKRGFTIKAVENDPLHKPIKQVAQIRFGPVSEEGARLLATHVPGAVLVNDKRTADTVDLAIGNAFKALGPVPTPTTTAPTLPPCPTITVSG